MTQLLYKWSRGTPPAVRPAGRSSEVWNKLHIVSKILFFYLRNIYFLFIFYKGNLMEKMKNITIKIDEADWEIFKIITKKILGSDASKEIRKFIRYTNSKYNLEFLKYSSSLKELQ